MERARIGSTTTVDMLERQQYSSALVHGVKRSYEQTKIGSPDNSVLQDVTNTSYAGEFAKRRSSQYRELNRIKASRICSVSSNSIGQEQQVKHGIPPIPVPSQNPLLSLSHPKYGLPQALVKNFASLGINAIYPWQSSCLLGRGLLDGSKNLVYTAPTGGGKSLVADVLMLKRVIEDPSKKAILVLPYVALVQEKLKWLRKAVEGVQKSCKAPNQPSSQLPAWRRPHDSSVRVVGFFGGSKARASWSDVDIAVSTIEKVVQSW